MAKIYGLFGSMTGKLADTVMSVRNGEQIARKYQPVVFNPSTPAQVAVRAKLKLLSQMSAVMAPVIAIRREGPVSSRNLFTKKNYPTTSYSEDAASINLEAVQLTNSIVGLGEFTAVRGEGSAVAATVNDSSVDRVVIVSFVKQPDNTLRLYDNQVLTTSVDGTFTTSLGLARSREFVVYAYGVRDNTDAARATFGSMQAITAEAVAKLITSRALLETDVTVTETKAVTVPVAQS